MKTYLDCYPCFLRQTLEATRMAELDESRQYHVLQKVTKELNRFEMTSTPPEMAYTIHQIVRNEVNGRDPYQSAKEESTRQALALYPRLKTLVAEADDPFETAVRLSIAGNIIDLGMTQEYNLEETIERVLTQPFAIDALASLRKAVRKAEDILYLADNAGETVFDRVLIETLAKPVTYVVKGGPILNDATRQDALAAGLDRTATIADNGSNAPGTLIKLCSEEFQKRLAAAKLIIAKGQANYESLSGFDAPIFFLLQAKCPVIAHDLGVSVKSIVVLARESARS
jgi:damage-control phosphatase, subfamily I